MRIKASEGKFKEGEIEKILFLLKSFKKDEFKKILDHMLIIYRDEDTEEWKAMKKESRKHVNHLYSGLQNYHL